MGKKKEIVSPPDDSPAGVADEEYIRGFQLFLENYYGEHLEALLVADDPARHYSIDVEYAEFLDASPPLANLLYLQPEKLLSLFDEAVREAQGVTLMAHKQRQGMAVKEHVHVRLNVHGSAFECPETRPNIGRVRVRDVGRLLTLKGTVIRTGAVKILEGEQEYECGKCKFRFKVETMADLGNTIQLPSICPSEKHKPCAGNKFKPVEGSTSVCRDYQEIKIQESMQTLGMGSIPRSIVVVLENDLADTVKAGEEIMVTGLLFAKWRTPAPDARCDLELLFLANHIRKANEMKTAVNVSPHMIEQFKDFWQRFADTPFKGRNTILQNICPQVYGLFTVKLAVALTLIGGVQHVDASGTRVRGESHLLLVGDPGTGKSQFLKYAAKLSHRSIMTTGLGSTSAGLTVTAVKDGGDWMLEAGALVLADGGLCCIDEFDSIREADRATIHEAMEQQTLSVAKAGLVTTLNTRTTVFGVTNPKGHYDPAQPLTVNTTLSGPLLSRFDVVLVLLDTKNADWDKIVSSHILSEHSKVDDSDSSNDSYDIWNMAMLRSYIRYVRDEFKPSLTPEASRVISSYYQLQRRSAVSNAARTTIRMLESLIRLAQAHARLMFRGEVIQADAIAAVVCVESSMTTSAILQGMGNALHSSFADNPDEEYAKQEREILSKLDFIPSAPTNRPPTDSTNNVQAPERRPQGRSYYDAGNNLDNGNPITTQQRQPYVTALNSSGVVLNRLRKVPPTENVSDSQAKRLKETQEVGGLQSLSVLNKLRNPLANGQSQPIERAIGLQTQTEEGLLLGTQRQAEDPR
ncbi:hypothetical protein M758_1G252000 [Ceratodon purpureus]|nr:hypothetical protein M758_1G252000 [Ceratodon purpureus]